MIVVTGGAGFIGSNLVYGLNQIGREDIVVVDDLTHGEKHLNLNPLKFADYIDKDELFERLDELPTIEAIFHQGACSDTTERDGRFMMRNNYRYSQRLLQYAESRGCKFIYASSAAVYGNGDAGFREERGCESPLNVYGYSKLAFDNFVRPRLKSSKSQIVGLRYFNVYGPQERHKARMASVAMHLFDQLRAKDEMRLFEGSAGFRRDFVHVDDVIAVNLHFLGNSARGIFNCGSGQARSFVDVAQQVKHHRGSGQLNYIPFPQDLAGKYQAFTEASLEALRASGYNPPMLGLEPGILRYCEILSASNGYRRG